MDIRKFLTTWNPLTESNRRPSPYHGHALPPAIATIVAVFFLIPQITDVLPAPWNTGLADAMPATAAQQISTLTPDPDLLSVGQSYLILTAYTIGILLLTALIMRRRDS